MMEPAKDRMRNNVSELLALGCAERVLPERNMRSHLVIIDGIFRKDSAKVIRVERDQMISALAPDRPDQAFSISVLPGRAERGGPVPDAHCSHPSLERAAKCSVIVTNEIFGRRVPRACFGDLALQPLRRWVLLHVIAKEKLPGLQWSILPRHHVDRNRGLRDIDAQFEQLAVDPGSTPQWVFKTHSSDQIAHPFADPWPPTARTGLTSPVRGEAHSMPTHNCLWPDGVKNARTA